MSIQILRKPRPRHRLHPPTSLAALPMMSADPPKGTASSLLICDFCSSSSHNLLYYKCAVPHQYTCCSSCASFTQKRFDKMIVKQSTNESFDTSNSITLFGPPFSLVQKMFQNKHHKKQKVIHSTSISSSFVC